MSLSRAFRPLTITRGLSSLRSSPGPRGTIGRRPLPAGIPDNATKASNELLRLRPSTQEAAGSQYNPLSTPVYIPEDPGAVITSRHPAARLLDNSALVVQRQLELGNLILGFEQANKYAIMDPEGNHVGFIAEEENNFTKVVMRQWARTHRSFRTHVFDKHGVEILKFHRPFSFINSTITAYDPVDPRSPPDAPSYVSQDQYRIIGECQQQWHLLRRKYNLFLYKDKPEDSPIADREPVASGRGGHYKQFSYVDEPFLSWDFSVLTGDQPPRLIGSVNRNFAGFGREIFTDTGVYALRMDAASASAEPQHLISNTHMKHDRRAPLPSREGGQGLRGVGEVAAGRGMALDERAVMLAAAVSIDFDYFSRHSSMASSMGGGEIMPVVAGVDLGDAAADAAYGRHSTGYEESPIQPHQQQEHDHHAPPPQYQPYDHPPAREESQDTSSGGFWSAFDED